VQVAGRGDPDPGGLPVGGRVGHRKPGTRSKMNPNDPFAPLAEAFRVGVE
jgi:hypothetical protein